MVLVKKLLGIAKGRVSVIYNTLLEHTQTPSMIVKLCKKDCSESSTDSAEFKGMSHELHMSNLF